MVCKNNDGGDRKDCKNSGKEHAKSADVGPPWSLMMI
jgi:hypothetical protein